MAVVIDGTNGVTVPAGAAGDEVPQAQEIGALANAQLTTHYKRSNILGTVSQSGGVPTGAIIERGSNASGEYVRFADGVVAVPGHDAQQPDEIVPGVIDWPVPEPVPSQRELDELRYKRRAGVRDELIAWMAADNMSRVRSGEWTVFDLTGLMADPALQEANAYMATLSYELAAQAIGQATNPLMTQEIKDAWIAKLTEHFYLVP